MPRAMALTSVKQSSRAIDRLNAGHRQAGHAARPAAAEGRVADTFLFPLPNFLLFFYINAHDFGQGQSSRQLFLALVAANFLVSLCVLSSVRTAAHPLPGGRELYCGV